MEQIIYHIVIKSEFINQIKNNEYLPVRFEMDGFIHCTGDEKTLLSVANDYFLNSNEEILILRLKLDKIKSEVLFEAPAPIKGSGTSHLLANSLFPHIYGPLNLDAIMDIGLLTKTNNQFTLPFSFSGLEDII